VKCHTHSDYQRRIYVKDCKCRGSNIFQHFSWVWQHFRILIFKGKNGRSWLQVLLFLIVNNVFQLWTWYFSLFLSLSKQKYFKNMKTTFSFFIKIHIFILLLLVFVNHQGLFAYVWSLSPLFLSVGASPLRMPRGRGEGDLQIFGRATLKIDSYHTRGTLCSFHKG